MQHALVVIQRALQQRYRDPEHKAARRGAAATAILRFLMDMNGIPEIRLAMQRMKKAGMWRQQNLECLCQSKFCHLHMKYVPVSMDSHGTGEIKNGSRLQSHVSCKMPTDVNVLRLHCVVAVLHDKRMRKHLDLLRTSQYLLVAQQWTRVETRLLYLTRHRTIAGASAAASSNGGGAGVKGQPLSRLTATLEARKKGIEAKLQHTSRE